jgi:hypothetical protein
MVRVRAPKNRTCSSSLLRRASAISHPCGERCRTRKGFDEAFYFVEAQRERLCGLIRWHLGVRSEAEVELLCERLVCDFEGGGTSKVVVHEPGVSFQSLTRLREVKRANWNGKGA